MAYQPKSYRKFLAGTVTAAVVASAVAPAASAAFNDVPATDSHAENIARAAEMGLINGKDGNFMPYQDITRGQVAKILARYIGEVDTTGTEQFTDVAKSTDEELKKDALTVRAAGIFKGSNGELKSDAPITRQEMATVLVRLFELKDLADKESEVTDVDSAWETHRESIKILSENGVTTVKEFNPLENVKRAQFATFMINGIDVTTPVETELKVESVSAINNTTFEVGVTFAEEVTAADLAGTKLTLIGAKTVTATFSKLDGQTAVYTVDNKGLLQPGDSSADGTYKVTSSSVVVSEGTTTTYSEVLAGNQVKGFVYGKDAANNDVPVANATVKVGDRTVQTDNYGFYSVPTNAGVRTVEVIASGYFNNVNSAVEVSRNYVTAQNFELVTYDVTKLVVEGTAINEANSTPLNDATVDLYEKQNGSFVKVGSVTTDTDGKFTFGNTGSTVVNDPTTGELKFATDELQLSGEYKVVINKGLTAANFTDVYKEKSQEFTLSQSRVNTNINNVLVTPVKELESLTFDLTWTPDAAAALGAHGSATSVQVDLLDTNGRTLLESETLSSDPRSSTDTRVMNEAYDLVKKGFFDEAAAAGTEDDGGALDNVKPRIPTGTYYLRVNDGKNAITIIPVSITEGVNTAAPKTEISVAKSYSLTSSIGSIQYQQALATAGNLGGTFANYDGTPNDTNFLGDDVATNGADTLTTITAAGTARNADVDVNFEVTQNVNGVNVLVYDSVGAQKFQVAQPASPATGNSFSKIGVTATTDFVKLKQGVNYVATPVESPFVKANSAATFSPAGAASSGTATFAASSQVALIDLGTNGVLPATALTVNNIQLVNKAGQAVAETGKFTITAGTNLTTGIKAGTANDIEKAIAKLSGFTAGEYKLRIDIAGYKAKDTDYKTIYDFQEAGFQVATAFDAVEKTSLTGYVRYADTNANVADATNNVGTPTAEATIIVKNESGKIVAAADLGEDASLNYTVTDGSNAVLAAGKYTVIVRGPGFETSEQAVTLEANKQNVLNFTVQRGGKGLAKLSIRDSNNNAYTGGTNDITFTDSAYTSTTVTGVSLTSIDFTGKYVSTTSTGVERLSQEALSRGNYTLNIAAKAGVTHAYTDTFTITNINDTFYDVITLANVVSGKTIDLTVTEASLAGNTAFDYVVVKKDGNIVGTFREATAGTGSVVAKVVANATYTVELYSNGKFVGSQEVTVQDFNKSVTVGLDNADRTK